MRKFVNTSIKKSMKKLKYSHSAIRSCLLKQTDHFTCSSAGTHFAPVFHHSQIVLDKLYIRLITLFQRFRFLSSCNRFSIHLHCRFCNMPHSHSQSTHSCHNRFFLMFRIPFCYSIINGFFLTVKANMYPK